MKVIGNEITSLKIISAKGETTENSIKTRNGIKLWPQSVKRCLKKTMARSCALRVYIAQLTHFTLTLS